MTAYLFFTFTFCSFSNEMKLFQYIKISFKLKKKFRKNPGAHQEDLDLKLLLRKRS